MASRDVTRYLQVCGCTWTRHTGPACLGLCGTGRGTWQRESGTCRCSSPRTGKYWSHQSSTPADLRGEGHRWITLQSCHALCLITGESETCLPSMHLGSESSVLVLHRSPSPVPSIQIYIAWTFSPWGSCMYCCLTALLKVALADVAIFLPTITHLRWKEEKDRYETAVHEFKTPPSSSLPEGCE